LREEWMKDCDPRWFGKMNGGDVSVLFRLHSSRGSKHPSCSCPAALKRVGVESEPPIDCRFKSFKPVIRSSVRSLIRKRRMIRFTGKHKNTDRPSRTAFPVPAGATFKTRFQTRPPLLLLSDVISEKAAFRIGRRNYLSQADGMAFPTKRILFPSGDQFGSA
jgi:hypothetical protein